MIDSLKFNGRRYRLDDRAIIGSGGEADVYGQGDLAFKVYRRPSALRAAKLRAFPPGLPAEVVAPEGLLEDDAGEVVGYAMRRVRKALPFRRLINKSWRAGSMPTRDVLDMFRRLHDVVSALHGSGVIVGDLNEGNLLLSPGPDRHELSLIDADSMQFGGFACPVGHPRFVAPELYGLDYGARPAFSEDSDWYAFAVLLFQSLMYVHPYGGVHPSCHTLELRAKRGLYSLRSDVILPKVATPAAALPGDLAAALERVFEGHQRGVFDATLLELPWTRCGDCGLDHGRQACPVCAESSRAAVTPPTVRRTGGVFARRVAHAPGGGVVAATAVGGKLRYLLFDGEVMRREDGTVVAQGPPRPGLRVGLAPRATWLGARGGRAAAVAACPLGRCGR